jgi:hypothetical protein
MKAYGREKVCVHIFLTMTADSGEWLTLHPEWFIPEEIILGYQLNSGLGSLVKIIIIISQILIQIKHIVLYTQVKFNL